MPERSPHKLTNHLTVTANTDIVSELQAETQLSKSAIKSAIQKGALWLTTGKHTRRIRRIKKAFKTGDTIHFYYDEKVLQQQPQQAILLDDCQNYSVWYKPFGMLSQGSKWSDHCTIARWAETHLTPKRPAFIVHRLDKAATGIIIIAHSKRTASTLTRMFEQHHYQKTYHIIVSGDHSLRPQPDEINGKIDGKAAHSTFHHQTFQADVNISLVKVDLHTGRKHQIREHSASIGYPVIGDRLFHPSANEFPDELNLQLCAVELAFTCPFSKNAKLYSLPDNLRPNIEDITKRLLTVSPWAD